MSRTLSESFITELKDEATASRHCLERIPESVYEFKPHERSMSMGYLTLLVAEMPAWIATIINDGVIDFQTYKHFQLSTSDALLKHFDNSLDAAIDALRKCDDEQLSEGRFLLKNGDQVLFESSQIENVRSTINHWVHHRGQLTVYMRLNDIPVPSIYGPSADDNSFKAQ